MATRKQHSTNDEPRGARSKRPDEPLTPAELGRAVRELHAQLSRVVAEMDRAAERFFADREKDLGRPLRQHERHRGESDAEVWSRWQAMQVQRTRKAVGGMVEVSTKPAVVAAIETYAARGVRDLGARSRGHDCAFTALLVARGLITAKEAVEQSKRWRDGAPVIRATALAPVARLRSERERWREAYRVLGWDADVWPAPDTRRGLRGDLLRLYQTVNKPVTVVDPKTGEKVTARPNGKGRLKRDTDS